jgi:phosphoglycolate phosphatase
MTIAAIFDLDGTLIDSRRDLTKGVNLMRESFGLDPIPLETVSTYIGNGARKLAERSIAGTGVDVEEALKRMKAYYLEHLTDETTLYDGVLEGMKRLHEAGVKMCVITNKPQEAAEIVLERLGVACFLDEIIGGGSAWPLKPEPDALLYFIDKFNCDKASSWMVGDHYTDMEAGRLAGMNRCLAAYGFGDPHEESFELKADSFSDFVSVCLG